MSSLLRMTDEEYSNLAEALQYFCEIAHKNGYEITSFDVRGCVDPFGALLMCGRCPYPETVEGLTGIPRDVVGAFRQGFFGNKRFPGFSVKAYELGRLFKSIWC